MAWSTRQLAELANTTVKAVRHYHEIGLLDVPERAPNGYKQYGVSHLVRLVQIKRLSELGVPLAQIGAMERADEEPDEAIRVLDAELEATIERLTRIRADLAVILRHRAPPEVPPGFAPVTRPLSETNRSLLMVYSTIFSEEAMEDFRQMLTERHETDHELEHLPADADDAAIDQLARRMAPVTRMNRRKYPRSADPTADSPRGAKLAESALVLAVAELYNPAQIRVLQRVNEILAQEDDNPVDDASISHGTPVTPPEAAIAAAVSSRVRSCAPMGSSHAWTLHSGELDDGRRFFAKVADAHAEALDAEAAGLRWLAEAPGGAAVPEVFAAEGGVLVLEQVHEQGASAAAADDLGRRLAATHRAGAPSFGASWPGRLATLPLDNTPGDRWPEWYARRRLLPYLRDARDQGFLDSGDVARLEAVLARVADLAGPDEPPARIHGDLWGGNVLWSRGGAVLIDPAAHGGHRESDLAMLHLFGAPHLDRILAAYDEAFPLAEGWRDRVDLHQLHPLLAHVCLFGRGYRTQLLDAAERLA